MKASLNPKPGIQGHTTLKACVLVGCSGFVSSEKRGEVDSERLVRGNAGSNRRGTA